MSALNLIPASNGIYGYSELLPDNYATATDPIDLVVFLHGIGEIISKCSLSQMVDAWGPTKAWKAGLIQLERCIMLQPQSPNSWNAANVQAFISFALTKYNVKPKVHVWGLSMGGFGAALESDSFVGNIATLNMSSPGGQFKNTSGNTSQLLKDNGVKVVITCGSLDYYMGNCSDMTTHLFKCFGYTGKNLVATKPQGNATVYFNPLTKAPEWQSGQVFRTDLPPYSFTIYDNVAHTDWQDLYGDPNYYDYMIPPPPPPPYNPVQTTAIGADKLEYQIMKDGTWQYLTVQ